MDGWKRVSYLGCWSTETGGPKQVVIVCGMITSLQSTEWRGNGNDWYRDVKEICQRSAMHCWKLCTGNKMKWKET